MARNTHKTAEGDEQELPTSLPQGGVRATLLTQSAGVRLQAGQLLIVCSRPGFRRAGLEHPHVKIWEQGELTPEQISELQQEPLITVVEISTP